MKPDPHHQHQPRDYQDKDIPLRPLLMFGLWTAIFVVLTFFGLTALYRWMDRSVTVTGEPSRFSQDQTLPPEPRLQVVEKRTLLEQRAIEAEQLNSYGWIDEKAGVARIPVERAIELTAERGLPARKESEGK